MSEATKYRRIVRYVSEAVWAIRLQELLVIRELVAFRAAGGKLDASEVEERISGGRQRPQQTPGPIAVLPLWGVLVPHAGMMIDVSTPGTGLDMWLEAFRSLVADPNVETILLDVNSPGGSADLVTEVAAEVRAARGRKQIVAVANTMAASAAYAIASQAETLICTPSGLVGSVGVYTVHEDISGALEAEGVTPTVISAPLDGFKTEGNPFGPLTDEAKAHMQQMVNAYYAMFVSDVAKGRGIDSSTVEANYGRGRVLTAGDALKAGMVDGVASRDQVLAKLSQGQPPVGRSRQNALTSGVAAHSASAAATLTTFELTPGLAVSLSTPGATVHQDPYHSETSAWTAVADANAELLHIAEGPIPPRSTPVIDQPWDGSAEVAKLPRQEGPLREMHAWVDSAADPNLKGSYKFPHHQASDPNGKPGDGDETVGDANVNGVRNGLARLEDPATQIPEADKAGVRAHLQRHLDDFHSNHMNATASTAAIEGREPQGGNSMEPISTSGRPPTLEELAAQLDYIATSQENLNEQAAGRMFTTEEQEQWGRLVDEKATTEQTIEQLRERQEYLGRQAQDKNRHVAGVGVGNGRTLEKPNTNVGRNIPENIFDLSAYRAFAGSVEELADGWKEGAKRANEKLAYETREQDRVRGFVERLLAKDHSAHANESFAHRILITANPAYERAFGKLVMGKPLTSQEDQLIRMAVSNTGLSSETPVPVTIDPSVILTSDGATNPLRQIARTVTITGNTWQGISSDGVSVVYEGELATVGDQTPDFLAPKVEVVKAHGWVEFSLEVDQDWGSFRGELTRMFNDARDVAEAEKFLSGNGADQPEGLVFALDADTTSVIQTETINTLALSDIEGVPNEIPSRFDTSARWLAHKSLYADVRSLAGAEGRIDVWVPLSQGFASQSGMTQYGLLGYPVTTASEMSKALTTGGEYVAILGDFGRGFIIVDRVGLNVEVVPLVASTGGRPKGTRGMYVYYRNSSKLLAANAFRILQIKPSA